MERDEILVSIIIPTYGDGRVLQRCVDSVLSQTYSNIECIVVDDNGIGTINQKLVEKEMAKYVSDSRVKYICHETNRNGSAARNTGVKNSNGEYIALLDDDDEFLPDKIFRQVNLLKSLSDEYGFVYCSHKVYLGDKLVKTNIANKSGYLFYEKLTKQFSVQTSGVLIRKSVYLEFNGFDESFRRHQDWEFIERIMSKYKIQADEFVGYVRHLYFRNSSVDPDKRNEWMEHYLRKMAPYIDLLPKKQAKEVYEINRLEISLVFLKNKRFKDFFLYCKKNNTNIKQTCLIIGRVLKSLMSGGPVQSN